MTRFQFVLYLACQSWWVHVLSDQEAGLRRGSVSELLFGDWVCQFLKSKNLVVHIILIMPHLDFFTKIVGYHDIGKFS